MHDLKILEQCGCGQNRLRTIFTAEAPTEKAHQGLPAGSSPAEALTTAGTREVTYHGESDAPAEPKSGPRSDWEIRKDFEKRVRDRVLTGIATGIDNTRPLQAVDIAWDAPPIQKETIPLLLWAQGKIKHKDLVSYLNSTLSPTEAAKFLQKDPKSNEVEVQIPRICETSVNLVRSGVTRRHAALAGLWDNLWPLLRYDPRGTDEVASLRADALTQRVDIMADDYNYRHFLSQCDRDKLLYTNSLIFPRSAWDRKTSVRWKKTNTPGGEQAKDGTEPYVVREGVDCVNPHPSRWFWDLSAPLANVNTDNGPGYLGYWDIVPYGTLLKGDYYNTKKVVVSEGWAQLLKRQSWYFAQYFQPCVLNYPALGTCTDPALRNDRTGAIGLYSANDHDKGVLLTQYFEKINPKVEGIGDYDNDVWIRLTAAGDGTIVAAEFMPSLPACYGAINANDNRLANASLAMELLPYQDMASNIVTTMWEQVRRSFTQLWLLNKDVLGKELCEKIEKDAKNQAWWLDPQVMACSFSQLTEQLAPGGGFNLNGVVATITVQLGNAVGQALSALGQVLALVDRLVNSSPNELGQPNPREVSSREVQEISTTTQAIYSFYNEGPREQRAAFKRLLYESLVCCGSETVEMPVLSRYRKKTIEAAGFKVVADIDAEDDDLLPEMTRIRGHVGSLNFSYYFDSRDGAERASNTQGAQVLQQFLVGLLQIEGVAQALGKERLFKMLNIIGRMVGAPDEFQIQLNDGEDEELPTAAGAEGLPPQVQQAVAELMQNMQQLAAKDAQIEQALTMVAQKLGLPLPSAPQPPAGAAPTGQPPAAAPAGVGGPPVPPAPAVNGASILQNPTR
jgi:hypothetical protein